MCASSCLLVLAQSLPAAEAFGGGPLPANLPQDCIPAAERLQAEQNLKNFVANRPAASLMTAGPEPYRFQPIAGTVWQDRFILNFVDLDWTPGILDWDCSQFTYDGHGGHDILLRGFGEQDVGVPVYAVLDGFVADAHDGEYDRNTSLQGQPANYVILFHGGVHYTWYWHLRRGSVAVGVGQEVRAGSQIGQ